MYVEQINGAVAHFFPVVSRGSSDAVEDHPTQSRIILRIVEDHPRWSRIIPYIYIVYEIAEDNVFAYADGKMSLHCAENKTLSPKYKQRV